MALIRLCAFPLAASAYTRTRVQLTYDNGRSVHGEALISSADKVLYWGLVLLQNTGLSGLRLCLRQRGFFLGIIYSLRIIG